MVLLCPGVSGVTVRTGETDTKYCKVGSVTETAAFWYKQISGGFKRTAIQLLTEALGFISCCLLL